MEPGLSDVPCCSVRSMLLNSILPTLLFAIYYLHIIVDIFKCIGSEEMAHEDFVFAAQVSIVALCRYNFS